MMVTMTCCDSHYATVAETLNHTCPASAPIAYTFDKAVGSVNSTVVMADGARIGYAARIHGFIYYEADKGGVKAVIASNGSDYAALATALSNGLENGRDDRQ